MSEAYQSTARSRIFFFFFFFMRKIIKKEEAEQEKGKRRAWKPNFNKLIISNTLCWQYKEQTKHKDRQMRGFANPLKCHFETFMFEIMQCMVNYRNKRTYAIWQTCWLKFKDYIFTACRLMDKRRISTWNSILPKWWLALYCTDPLKS